MKSKTSERGDLTLLSPNWPHLGKIQAYTTTRLGGVSQPPFASFNLGLSTQDNPQSVNDNRALLETQLSLPSKPYWLIQTHSNTVIEATNHYQAQEADASYTSMPNIVCAVMTADCLPLLVAHKEGKEVAAIHAGWRSLLEGIIENCIDHLADSPNHYYYWLGPAISQKAFEVGEEVYAMFVEKHIQSKAAFIPSHRPHHYYADIYQLAQIRLASKKVPLANISGGDHCTFTEAPLFFSHRRNGNNAGRQASLIWINK